MVSLVSNNRRLLLLSLIVLALAPNGWGSAVVFCFGANGHGVYESLFSWCCSPAGTSKSTTYAQQGSLASTESRPACGGCVDVSVNAAQQSSRSEDAGVENPSSSDTPGIANADLTAAIANATGQICTIEAATSLIHPSQRPSVLRC